jgi:tetratricopeptide (TPR) repeat protein
MPSGDDFWARDRKSPLAGLASVVRFAFVIPGLIWMTFYGVGTLGFPPSSLGLWIWPAMIVGHLAIAIVHEFGHALIALALGFHFETFNAGPLTLLKDPYGQRHYIFDWSKLLSASGYVGAVPSSEQHLRSNWSLVVLGGPLATLVTSLLLWRLLLSLPGTPWASGWYAVGLASVIFAADFPTNLLPIGRSDGSMLFHLILWTRHGQTLHASIVTSKAHHDAREKFAHADTQAEIELCRHALQRELKRAGNSLSLAHAHQSLGFALVRGTRLKEAAESLEHSIEVFNQCPKAPALMEGNSWYGLERIYQTQHRVADARRCYESALLAFERAKLQVSGDQLTDCLRVTAHLHLDAGNAARALAEIEQAIGQLPEVPKHLLVLGELWVQRSECESQLGYPDRATEAATHAARLFGAKNMPESARNHALKRLGLLAHTVRKARRDLDAVGLLREAAAGLDQRGLSDDAAGVHIQCAAFLRETKDLDAAAAELPPESSLRADQRTKFVSERAEISLAKGDHESAIADFEEALRLTRADAGLRDTHVASAEECLARALFEGGRIEEAERLATQAYETLKSENHPDAAEPLITLALIAWKRHASGDAFLAEALSITFAAPFVGAFERARFLENTSERLHHAGRSREAADCLDKSAEQWAILGIEKAAPIAAERVFLLSQAQRPPALNSPPAEAHRPPAPIAS